MNSGEIISRLILSKGVIMKGKYLINVILSIVVAGIGVFMVVKFAGKALPPQLSGIAFILIGIALLIKK